MLQETQLNQKLQMKTEFIIILLGLFLNTINTQQVEVVNIEGFGQPQETILQYLREFGSRVSQQSSKLFLLAQQKKTRGIKLIFLSASANDIKYIGIESQDNENQNQSKIKTYIESNSLQTSANAIGMNPDLVKLNEEERVNYSNLLTNSFACSIKQPQQQQNRVQSSITQQAQRLQNQSSQNKIQNTINQNIVQSQNLNEQNRIQIKLPDYSSILAKAYSESLLYPEEQQTSSQTIELDLNGRLYRVDCDKLNLPIDYLTNNQNVMNLSDDEQQNETRTALIQAYNQCTQFYENNRNLTNQDGTVEFDLYRLNQGSQDGSNQSENVLNLYRYSGKAEPLIPDNTGPSQIDINRTNQITTTVTRQEVQKPAENQQQIQLSNFSLDNFDNLLNILETNQEGLDVFSLQKDRSQLNDQQNFQRISSEKLVQPQNRVQTAKILTINSNQQNKVIEQSSQDNKSQNQQNVSQQQNMQNQQTSAQQQNMQNQSTTNSQISSNNEQQQNINIVPLTKEQLLTQQQIQDQFQVLSEQMLNNDSQTIDEFQQQIAQLLNNQQN